MRHFENKEFACPCCGRNEMNNEFKELLDKAREIAGVPFVINSGFRCPDHNKEIGGSETSSHLKGLAVDIHIAGSRMRYKIVEALLAVGLARVGIGDNFIHVDNDHEKDEKVIWTY